MTNQFKFELQERINLIGSRAMARLIVSNMLNRVIGLSLECLPDSIEICDAIDEIESKFDSGDLECGYQYCKDLVKDIEYNLNDILFA